MRKKAKITLHPSYKIGRLEKRLYGSFLECVGTLLNGSVYNPAHPSADENGFRRDIIEAVRESGMPAVRLPGGNLVSGWDWKDSIGPKDKRRSHLDLAWRQYLSNDVGHDEYLQWAEKAGCEPMYTINLGTGDINDALSIIEYTNHPGGTYWSDLRKQNGHKDPYGVKIWYLGNEMDGPWQIGSWQKDPRGYGIKAHEISKAMKWVDPTIQTVVCASSSPFLASYPQWDMDVLEQCYETVDMISLHHYHPAPPGDIGAYLGGSAAFEEYINTEIALCDTVQAKLRSTKKMMLSFDEYGYVIQDKGEYEFGRAGHAPLSSYEEFTRGNKPYIRHDPNNMDMMGWQGGDMLNALSIGSVLLTLMRHADRIKIGCATLGLMAAATTDRDHLWKSGVYYPYTQLMRYGRGMSLMPVVECDTFDVPGYAINNFRQYNSFRGIKYLESAAAFDEEKGVAALFVINRNGKEDLDTEIDLRGFEGYKLIEHSEMTSDDISLRSSYENPDAVIPSVNGDTVLEKGRISVNLKKLSWNVFRLAK